MLRWKCNVLTLSDDEARSLGVDLKKIRALIIVAATAVIASCVSMCGQVGWVGLLVPHVCRLLFGNSHARLLPACISCGACVAGCPTSALRMIPWEDVAKAL